MALAACITVLAGGVELFSSHASGSLFLLADAVHLLAHLGIFLVLLIPPGRLHGASEDLGAVAVLLIIMAIAGWLLWLSVDRLLRPPEGCRPRRDADRPRRADSEHLLGAALPQSRPRPTSPSARRSRTSCSDGAMTLGGLAGAGCIAVFRWRRVDPTLGLVIRAGSASGRCVARAPGGPRTDFFFEH